MAMSKRAKRRLTLLIAIVLLLGVGVGGLYAFRQSQRDHRAQAARQQGMAAYEQQQFGEAHRDLRTYLARYPDDVEALYKLAQARLRMPEDNGGHVLQAIRSLQKVLQLKPDHLDAAYDLLELYSLTGNDNQTLVIASQVLEQHPNDIQALSAKSGALMRQHKPAEALEAARAVIEVDPSNWRMHLLSLRLQQQLGTQTDELIAQAQQQLAEHPEDPRFELILGYAYDQAQQREKAAGILKQAASRDSVAEDELFVLTLVRYLDQLSMFSDSLHVLSTAADKKDASEGLEYELVQRLFEIGRYEDVQDRLSDTPMQSQQSEYLALRALSLYNLKMHDEAEAATAMLESKERDPLAATWASIIRTLHASDSTAKSNLVKICEQAIKTFPDHPIFNMLLGEAYYATGELELALPHLNKAAKLRKTWAAPAIRQANVLLRQGQTAQAIQPATSAIARQPDNIEAAVVWVQAQIANLSDFQSDKARELLAAVKQIQTMLPGETRTFAIYVDLLGRMGNKQEASRAIRDALAGQPKVEDAVILQLAKLSQRYDLGLEDACYAAVGQQGVTPDTALAQAMRYASAGDPGKGLEHLDQAIANAKADADSVLTWQIVRARYLEQVGDEQAGSTWIELADQHPDNAQIQQLALRAASTHMDHAFVDRAITRLKDTLGEQSLLWRIERARWLLAGPIESRDPSQASDLLREVIAQAPNRIEPRLLMSQAQEQLNLLPLAIRELRSVAQLQPDSVPVSLELARLNQAMRHFRTARDQLDGVLANPAAQPDEQRRAAIMLARQGENEIALKVLQKLYDAGDMPRRSDQLLLAHLYRRLGQNEQAVALSNKLLATPTADVIVFLADLYTAMGQPEQAATVMAMLGELDMPADEIAMVRGEFHSRQGEANDAVDQFRKAVEADATDVQAWYRLVAVQLMMGKSSDAVADAKRGLAALPDEQGLAAVVTHAALLKQGDASEALRPLAAVIVNDARHREPAIAALQLVTTARSQQQPATQVARQLASIAEGNSEFLAVQVLLARYWLAAGRPTDAANVATRAMQAFPEAVEPAWLATQAFAAAGQWERSLMAAAQWRQRAVNAPQSADLAMAEAQLQMGDPKQAMRIILPYLEQAAAAPAENRGVLTIQARALIASGQADEASQLLSPMLTSGREWRELWMQLAANVVPTQQQAEGWLKQADQVIASEAIDERVALSRCWWLAGGRLNAPAFQQIARRTLEDVVQHEDAPAGAWYNLALMAEQQGDTDTAEQCYQKAISLDPDLQDARNNLAMLLVAKPAYHEEALALAKAATQAQPGNANYLDTLAQVYVAVGRCEDAIATMEAAVQLEPQNQQWHANLAKILEDCGQRD